MPAQTPFLSVKSKDHCSCHSRNFRTIDARKGSHRHVPHSVSCLCFLEPNLWHHDQMIIPIRAATHYQIPMANLSRSTFSLRIDVQQDHELLRVILMSMRWLFGLVGGGGVKVNPNIVRIVMHICGRSLSRYTSICDVLEYTRYAPKTDTIMCIETCIW